MSIIHIPSNNIVIQYLRKVNIPASLIKIILYYYTEHPMSHSFKNSMLYPLFKMNSFSRLILFSPDYINNFTEILYQLYCYQTDMNNILIFY